ncbi:MAG: DUF1795 domain-containing protein [Clostridia bacterium]|nr:DUF1795 domain-containing protein [Clostridia bacterium]
MKKIVCLLLILVFALSAVSCGKESDVPSGMMLCRGGESIGYNFYVPEEWTVSNIGEISAAYVSTVNPTSVSLAEAEMGTYTDLDAYFNAHKTEFPYEITVVNAGEAVRLGNADEAKSYVYDFIYQGHTYRTLQVLAKVGERFFIFTYNALNETYMNSDTTYYGNFFEKASSVMENVKFTDKVPVAPATYVFDAEGYATVSDKREAGFLFRMKDGWTCETASGIVRVFAGDGSSVVVSEATDTGVSVSTYWKNRQEALAPFIKNLVVIEENAIVSVANASNAARYEYTFTYGDRDFHVIQYLMIGGRKGYVFTYTAETANFESHKADAEAMANKLEF